ncbi:MAG: DUF5518 domain-containing protein [Methanobacteriaceae archaeon]|jgi:hypothetical protein|nr:MAG: hypothetical protein CIT01_06050 [Methanobacterium sp. BRmetb2]MCC7558015.1 DUF5518 domain-containing protein [Methanobacteriaceae archaeon]
MTDWKAIGIGAIITAVFTIILVLAFFPLFFLGPLAGGFITIYFIKEGELEGIKNGALAGVIGGLIIGFISFIGFGAISAIISLFLAQVGIVVGTIGLIIGVVITIIAVLICGVLGAVGGAIGESAKKNEEF